MDCVHVIPESPVTPSQQVAVVIGEPDVGQRHIGILHRAEGAEPHFLHLAWHCKLRSHSALPQYITAWVAPSFPPRRLRNLAALCRRVWKKNCSGGIPYAFSNPTEAFDGATGAFLLGPTRFGLTCASFVLAVFDGAGLSVADCSSWPINRPGDREWQDHVIAQLAEQNADPQHIEHLRSEIGSVRYRPEEVAAAVALAPPSAAFDAAAYLGEQILVKLQSPPTSSAS